MEPAVDTTHPNPAMAPRDKGMKNRPGSKGRTAVVTTAMISIILTLLAAVLYVQGRFYHESYLLALGINPYQFPITTADAYWYALNALALMVGKGIPAVWHAYPQILVNVRLAILFSLVLMLLTSIGERRGWFDRLKTWLHRRGGDSKNKKTKRDRPSLIWIPALGLAPTLLMPLLVILCLWMIGLIIYMFALPYDLLGRKEAQYECERAATDYQLVLFNGDENNKDVSAAHPAQPTARLIQCSEDFCVLIRDGATFVIQRSAIIRTIGTTMSLPSHTKSSSQPATVPQDKMLCYKPNVPDKSLAANDGKRS